MFTNLGQGRGKMDGARGWRRGSGDGGIGRMRNGARWPRVRRSARRAMRRTARTSSAVALKSARTSIVAMINTQELTYLNMLTEDGTGLGAFSARRKRWCDASNAPTTKSR